MIRLEENYSANLMYSPNHLELSQLLLERMPIAAAMFDREMRYLLTNRRWLTDYGLANQDIIGHSYHEMFPGLPDHWQESQKRCLAGTVERSNIDCFGRADGSVLWLKWEMHPWRQPTGEIGGITLFTEPIAPNKRTKEVINSPLTISPTELKMPPSDTQKLQLSNIDIELNPTAGTCTFGGYPAVTLWLNTSLAGLMSGLQAMVGEKRFSLALQRESLKGIEEDWQIISQYPDFRDGFAAIAQYATCAGWGNWQVVSLDWQHKQGIFRVINSWEGRYQKALGVCWGSGLVAGKFAGYATKLFDTNCWTEQTAFVARGDAYDEFVVRPSERTVEEEMDKLLETDEATRADMAVALQQLRREVAERQQTEAALRASETRFQKLADNMPGVVYQFVLHPNGSREFLYISSGCLELYELEPEAIQENADLLWGLTHPEDLESWQDSIAISAIEMAPWHHESRLITPSGKLKWVQGAARPEKLKGGGILWEGLLLDITKRKQAEEQLRQYQEQLEEKVAERTAELARANQQLQAEMAVSQAALSARQQTEEALRESKTRFQKMAANVPGMIYQYVLRPDGSQAFLYISPGCREIYELEPEVIEQETTHVFNQVHPDDRRVVEQTIGISAETLQPWICEWRNITPSGKVKWTQGQSRPEKQANGDIIWDGVVIDITERKHAEEAVQESYSLIHSVIESTPDIILAKDLQGRYVMLNSNLASFFGKPMAELIGKNDVELFPSETAQQICETDRQVMTTGFTLTYEELIPNNGLLRTHLTTKSPWRDSQGDIIGLTAISRDITDRKQAEEAVQQSEAREREKAQQLELTLKELQQTQSQLVQTEKMSSLGQLVAGVAHEINNPVNFIFGNLVHASEYTQDLLSLIELYQQQYPQPTTEILASAEAIDLDFLIKDLPNLLSSMKVGTERIREIVRSLRNFSRLDEAEMKAVDIHEGIDSTLMILQNRLKAKPEHPGIQVIKEYGKLPPVECYVGQLNQVFMNLITNALDALDENIKKQPLEQIKANPSTIRIQTEVVKSGKVVIRIADNGPGMTAEVKQRLFDPFFTTKPTGQGTGLGLSISYQIVVEKHGGQLYCSSQLGKGTEFVIEIPLRVSY